MNATTTTSTPTTARERWARAYRDARTYGYVPTGLPGRGSSLDYRALWIAKEGRHVDAPPTPGAVVRAAKLAADDFSFLHPSAADRLRYARRQGDGR